MKTGYSSIVRPLLRGALPSRVLLLAAGILGFAGAVRAEQAADTAADGLQEVVVTAQRRSEDIQKTPLAITALSSDTLTSQGVVNPVGLQDLVPSLNIVDRGGTGTNIAIRGLVSNTTAPQGGPSVSVNVDDIFVARTQATNASFFDIDRIEVLRGPQGTLYGKNSTAGAVNIITNDPKFAFGANLGVEVGNYGELNTNGMINVPLSDKLAVRASFQTLKHDGYIGNLDDADSYAARIKLLYTPTDDVSLLLNTHYNHQGGHGPTDVGYSLAPGAVNPSDPWTQNLYPANAGNLNNDLWGVDGHLNWHFSFATLTYIVGYEVLDIDNSHITQLQALSTFSQVSHAVSNELRLASNNQSTSAGSITWVVGAYAFNEKQSYDPSIASGPLSVIEVEPSIPDNSRAAFGQATFSVTDRIRLTGGVRQTHDYEGQNGTFTEHIGPNTVTFPISGEVSYNNTSWKGGLEADLSENVLGYVSATTGYHAGGLTDSIPATAPQGNVYRPERVTDYEAGLKGRWFDNRVQVSSNVFYYDYKDLQVGVLAPPFFPTTYNAQKARLMGWETDASWLVTRNDLLGLSAIYEDSKYLEYCVPSAFYNGSGPITTCADGVTGYNYSNRPFGGVPRWAGNLNYRHTFLLPNGASLVPALASRFKTRYSTSATETQPGYSNSSATLTYGAPADRWSALAFVRNIENKPDYTSSGTLMNPTLDLRTPVAPRTFGVRLDVKF
jgi:iron complex outermembrane receptor protein